MQIQVARNNFTMRRGFPSAISSPVRPATHSPKCSGWTMFRRSIAGAVLRASLVLALVVQTANADTLGERVDKIFAPWNKANSPGCAVVVVQNGDVLYERGYGMADIEHDVPISPTTVFNIASVSKQFTAAAISLLAQRGKLSVKDPVRRYIPELPEIGESITIDHLIHHTSGLRDELQLLALAGWHSQNWEDAVRLDDVMDLVSRMKELNFRPGERYLYSNTNYTLLAVIVNRVSGKSLGEFSRTEIFEPLGMRSTHFRNDNREVVKGIAYGYQTGLNSVFRRSNPNIDIVGAGNLLTTVQDLARWQRNFEEPKVGGQDFVSRMLQPYTLNDGSTTDYLAGLVAGEYRGLPVVSHSGGVSGGFQAYTMRLPRQNLSIACLCNTAAGPTELARSVADIYLQDQRPKETRASPEPVAVSADTLSRFVGVYWNRRDDDISWVSIENGKLAFDGTDLIPLSDSTFQSATKRPFVIAFTGKNLQIGSDKWKIFDRMDPPAADTDLAAYTGQYYCPEIDTTFEFEATEGRLALKRKKRPVERLTFAFKDTLTSSSVGGTIRFERDANGRVAGLRVSTGWVYGLHCLRRSVTSQR